MALNGAIHGNGQNINFLSAQVITTAVTAVVTSPVSLLTGAHYIAFQVNLVVGGGGTTAKFWLQTTFDSGLTWTDIANIALTTSSARRIMVVTSSLYFVDVAGVTTPSPTLPVTPTDGTLSDNTAIQGLIGSKLRLKYTTTGTYTTNTNVTVTAVCKG